MLYQWCWISWSNVMPTHYSAPCLLIIMSRAVKACCKVAGGCLQASCKSKVTSRAKEISERDARIQQLEITLQRDVNQAQKRSDSDAQAIASRDDAIAELEVWHFWPVPQPVLCKSCFSQNGTDQPVAALTILRIPLPDWSTGKSKFSASSAPLNCIRPGFLAL